MGGRAGQAVCIVPADVLLQQIVQLGAEATLPAQNIDGFGRAESGGLDVFRIRQSVFKFGEAFF